MIIFRKNNFINTQLLDLGEAMAIKIVRLGSPREAGEGLRIGTVRHPPGEFERKSTLREFL